jgi:predicted acyltransferase
VAKAFTDVKTVWGDVWQFLSFHQSHVDWVGCSLHDMIQPSFTFLVGVALPFSIASRLAKGQSRWWMTIHAFWRAVILILLGVFLRSQWGSQTNWTFEDTLTQIGLGYIFLFMIGFGSFRVQIGTLVLILVGYWGAFALYPLPGADFDWAKAGVAADWEHHLTGFAAHWNKNTNPAWAFDVWFMNLFPRPLDKPFLYNGGGYATLSFIPTLATMILGLLAGNFLRSNWSWFGKFCIFVLLGGVCLGLGWGLDALGICPVVKRIWTPAWVLYSGGICFLILAAFYLLIDVARLRPLVLPLIVIGSNSIVAYCIKAMSTSYFTKNLKIHLGADFFQWFGVAYEPLFLGAVVLLINWLILLWLYRKNVHVRI